MENVSLTWYESGHIKIRSIYVDFHGITARNVNLLLTFQHLTCNPLSWSFSNDAQTLTSKSVDSDVDENTSIDATNYNHAAFDLMKQMMRMLQLS